MILLCLVACKSRKMDKQQTETSLKADTELELASTTTDKSSETSKETSTKESRKETAVTINTDNLKLTPVNPEKPIQVKGADGKEYQITNAIVETGQTSNNTTVNESTKESAERENTKQADVTGQTEIKGKSGAEQKSKSNEKKVQSEPAYQNWLWWLIIIAVLAIIIRWLYNRFKKRLKPF
jgi:hypothetical protein